MDGKERKLLTIEKTLCYEVERAGFILSKQSASKGSRRRFQLWRANAVEMILSSWVIFCVAAPQGPSQQLGEQISDW